MEINKMGKDFKKSFKSRVLTAAILLLVGVPSILIGNWLFLLFISLCSILAIHEFLTAARSEENRYPITVYIAVMIMTISFVFWVFAKRNVAFINDNFHIEMTDIQISTMGMAFLIGLLFMFTIIFEKVTISDVCYLFTMSMFLGIALQSVLFLRFSPEALVNLFLKEGEVFRYPSQIGTSFLMIFVCGIALLNDVFAYAVGVLFGKHKMNPRISPKKTWEGFAGGIVLSMLFGLLFAFIADACGYPVLKGLLDREHWYWVVIFSFLISIMSVLGDFMFSAIKRHYQIKDFGKILPGHGGILDRFDSVLITSFVVSVLILFITYLPFNVILPS